MRAPDTTYFRSPLRPVPVMAMMILLGLTACGGGGSSTTITEAGPNGLPYGAAGLLATQSRFEQLEDTEMTLSGAKGDYVRGALPFTNTSETLTAELTLLDEDTIRLELDGQTYTLSEAGGLFTDTIGTQVVTLTPGFAGSVTASIFFFKVESVDGTAGEFYESFLLTGFETKPSDMPSTGSATYNGTAGMLAYETSGGTATLISVMDDTEGATGATGDGDLAMTVNYATGAATGAITGTAGAAVGGGAVNLTLAGTVSGNDVTGTLTDVSGNADLVFNSGAAFAFSGIFYGAEGRDLGGSFATTITGAEVDEPTEAVGFFVGSR